MSRCLAPFYSAAVVLLAVGAARGDKREKWVELDSPHFVVISNANEKQAGRVADQFEGIRAVFHKAFPGMRVDPSAPIIVLAARDQKTFDALQPEAWRQKGHLKMAGMFSRGTEKNFVLLRLDTEDPHPYGVVYHEYTHLLVDQNAQSIEMPLWLNEGLAEFYGNSEIREKEILLGEASESHVLLLREQKLLPLATLFTVNYSSPYYNEENKGSIFYAESWALTHLLMFKGGETGKNLLGEFLTLLGQNVEPAAAATRAFGDLGQLQKDLEAYVRQVAFKGLRMKGATGADEGAYKVRELSPVESAVARADFLVNTQRFAEARDLLADALREPPNFALAHETLGLLEFRQGHPEEAKKRFEEAVKLDSRSFFAHYYYAIMTMQESRGSPAPDQVESSLRKAIAINPRFAPAYNALASFDGLRGEHLDEAHRLALQAIQLEPGNVNYFMTVASILLRQNRAADAVRVAERARGMAKTLQESAAVQSFLESAHQYEDYLNVQVAAEKQAQVAARERQALKAQGAQAGSEPHTAQSEPSEPASVEPPGDAAATPSARRDLVEGVIVEVSCASPAVMKLTVALPGYKLELHSANYYRVEFTTDNWTPPSPFNPCKHIKGVRARVVFSIDPKSQGEIVSVNLLGPGGREASKQKK